MYPSAVFLFLFLFLFLFFVFPFFVFPCRWGETMWNAFVFRQQSCRKSSFLKLRHRASSRSERSVCVCVCVCLFQIMPFHMIGLTCVACTKCVCGSGPTQRWSYCKIYARLAAKVDGLIGWLIDNRIWSDSPGVYLAMVNIHNIDVPKQGETKRERLLERRVKTTEKVVQTERSRPKKKKIRYMNKWDKHKHTHKHECKDVDEDSDKDEDRDRDNIYIERDKDRDIYRDGDERPEVWPAFRNMTSGFRCNK